MAPHVPPADTSTVWEKQTAQAAPEATRFLEGPQLRGYELMRATRVLYELMRGFRTLHFVGPCVTTFGSARFKEGHPYYALARDLGRELARAGFTVMTGGGPGLMEAVNRGAKEVGGRSVGCNIRLPREQAPNSHLDTWITFRHFFVRKLMLVKYSYAFVALPGGYGTMDEVFEVATLVQTGKIHDFPVALMGVEYWAPLLQFLRETMVKTGTIDPSDVDRLIVSDDPAEVVNRIAGVVVPRFNLTYTRSRHRRWWLFEWPARGGEWPPSPGRSLLANALRRGIAPRRARTDASRRPDHCLPRAAHQVSASTRTNTPAAMARTLTHATAGIGAVWKAAFMNGAYVNRT